MTQNETQTIGIAAEVAELRQKLTKLEAEQLKTLDDYELSQTELASTKARLALASEVCKQAAYIRDNFGNEITGGAELAKALAAWEQTQ